VEIDDAVLDAMAEILRPLAAAGRKITYGELGSQLTSRGFEKLGYRSPRLYHHLDELNCREHAAGRGALSAVVVRQRGRRPGWRFYEQMRGEPFWREGDPGEIWAAEVARLEKEGSRAVSLATA
jgi:DNA-binding transcriptional ArsR family regulator